MKTDIWFANGSRRKNILKNDILPSFYKAFLYSTFSGSFGWAFRVKFPADQVMFFQQSFSSSIWHRTSFKGSRKFKQLKELSLCGLNHKPSGHGPKFLTFVNDVTTMLFGGKSRAVENENMLLNFFLAQSERCMWNKCLCLKLYR